eukprot:400933-Pleurochrysis_carterae.AAC.1
MVCINSIHTDKLHLHSVCTRGTSEQCACACAPALALGVGARESREHLRKLLVELRPVPVKDRERRLAVRQTLLRA